MRKRLAKMTALALAVLLVLSLAGCARAGRDTYGILDKLADGLAPLPDLPEEEYGQVTDIFEDAGYLPGQPVEGANSQPTVTDEDYYQNLTLYTQPDLEVVFYKDMEYKGAAPDAPKANLFDVCAPAEISVSSEKRYPLIIFVPGGSWTTAEKESMRTQIITMAHYGYVAAAINTRTLPEYGLNAQVEDVLDAVKYLYDNATQVGIDTDNIYLAGGSSGGHLALLAAYTMGEGFTTTLKTRTYVFEIQAVCSLAAPVMAEDLAATGMDRDMSEADSRMFLSQLLGETVTVDDPDALLRADPRTYLTADSPPTAVLQGQLDVSVPPRNAEALYDALQENNVPSRLVMYADADHQNWPVARVLYDMYAFFEAHRAPEEVTATSSSSSDAPSAPVTNSTMSSAAASGDQPE